MCATYVGNTPTCTMHACMYAQCMCAHNTLHEHACVMHAQRVHNAHRHECTQTQATYMCNACATGAQCNAH